MAESQVEQEVDRDGAALETALKSLWEKARLASALIGALREERKQLRSRTEELEAKIALLKDVVTEKDETMERFRLELERLASSPKEEKGLGAEERAELRKRIRTLVERIDSYL